MSQENVEIVRFILDAWNRRDYSAALEPFAPDIRVEDYAFGGGLDATYDGNWHVVTVRDGKVVRYRILQTKPEALEAAGLSE